MREINRKGLDLIKSFEGLTDGDPSTVKLDPYIDPAGIWTIGWGHAIRIGNEYLRGRHNREFAGALYPGGISVRQAEQLLRGDLLDTCRDVESLVEVDLTDNEFAALVSLAFNIGRGNLSRSTLLRKLNEHDYEGAAGQFHVWNKAGGRVLKGLVRRRAAEAALFES
jgi:lysozyme